MSTNNHNNGGIDDARRVLVAASPAQLDVLTVKLAKAVMYHSEL